MINSFAITTFATEGEPIQETPEQNNGTEELNNDMQLIEKSDIITDTYGRIIEARSPREIQSGTVKDRVQDVKVEIIEGEYIGEEFDTTFTLSYDIEGKIQAYELDVGDKVLVQLSEDLEGHVTATVQDVVRSGYIIGMFILFLLSIVLVGGKKGVKAILGLLYTIILIYLIMIKGIFKGDNAIISSVGTSMLVILGTFIIIGGFNKKITTAAIGTLGGVISAGLMALIFNHLAKMSGACEDAIQLSVSMSTINFDFRDLLFAGIIVSALGACMDVGMSIASSLDEIKMKNPDITWKELLKSGMNIGRDVIGTMTNTLILAYVGGSLTLILLFMACNMSIIDILNKETIAEQIISAIAGSMGVIYTVPITSFIYSVLNKDKVIYKKNSENRIDGKRSLKI
jgi:uncharacterized membrane protein